MTKREAKRVVFDAVLDFIEYTRANPLEQDDGAAYPPGDRKKLDDALQRLSDELVRRRP